MTDELENLLNQKLPAGWRPEEGDRIIGRVTEVTEGWSTQTEDNYPIIVVNDENRNEPVAIHCFHSILKNEILKLQPQIGERVAIQFNGEKPLKDNPIRSVKLYRVIVEGRKADYSKMKPQKVDPVPDIEQPKGDNDEETPF